MTFIANLLRRFAKLQFQVRGLSTILDIGNEEFLSILARLESMGWKVYSRYGGFDAGIDYDCIRIKRGGVKLKCEWDNWNEWSIEGPQTAIQALAEQFNLVSNAEWRWARWDQATTKS